jgi:hypothetical protein
MRNVRLTLLASIVLLAALPEISAQKTKRPPAILFESITVVAIACVLGGVTLRRRFVREGLHLMLQDANSAPGLRRWQSGHIVGYVVSEAVALYGLNLRYAGFSFADVATFYVAGFSLMLFLGPRAPRVKTETP